MSSEYYWRSDLYHWDFIQRKNVLNLKKSTTFSAHLTVLVSSNVSQEILKLKLYTDITDAKLYQGRKLAFRSATLIDWEVFMYKEKKSPTKVTLSFAGGQFAPPEIFVNSREYLWFVNKWLKVNHGHYF